MFSPEKKFEKKIKYLKSIEKRNLEVSTARISGVTIDGFRLIASSPILKMMRHLVLENVGKCEWV